MAAERRIVVMNGSGNREQLRLCDFDMASKLIMFSVHCQNPIKI